MLAEDLKVLGQRQKSLIHGPASSVSITSVSVFLILCPVRVMCIIYTHRICAVVGGISSWENLNLLWWGRRKQPNLCSRSLATKAVFHANSLENTKNRGGSVLPRCTEVTPRNCLRAMRPGGSSRGSDGGLCSNVWADFQVTAVAPKGSMCSRSSSLLFWHLL